VASILADRSMTCRTRVNVSQIQWVVGSCSGAVLLSVLLAIVIAGLSVFGVWVSGGLKMVVVGIVIMVVVIRKSSLWSSTALAAECVGRCVLGGGGWN